MSKGKVYKLTDVDVILTVAIGFVISEISNMSVTLTNGDFSITYSTEFGDIEITDSNLILHIEKEDIAEPGIYNIEAIRITSTNGKVWGITPLPGTITFH